ncbi:beta-ketoacyl reductase [Tsukamurella soli]
MPTRRGVPGDRRSRRARGLIAGWLADRGARRVVLAGRTGLPPRSSWGTATDPVAVRRIAAVRELERRGVAVDVETLDIASTESLRALLARRDAAGAPPIAGVVHAAGIDDSALLADLDAEHAARVLAPKAGGAQALHAVFPPGSLDFVTATASAGAVFGVPGQGAYATANAYLDALAAERRAAGDTSLSLDWVAWHGLGFAAGSGGDVVAAELARMGSRPLRPAEAFAAWEYAADSGVPQAVMVPLPAIETAVTGDAESAPAVWAGLPHAEVVAGLESGLTEIIARELRVSRAELAVDLPFAELGINSLMAMSIRRDAERLVGTGLSVTMLWNHPTIEALAAYLAERVSGDDSRADGPAGGAVDVWDAPTDPPAHQDSVLDGLFDAVEAGSIDGSGL